MKLHLFEYVVLWHPNEKQTKEDGSRSVLIAGPKSVMASSADEVKMQAAMDIPEQYKKELHQVEIGVRPF